MSGKLEFEFRFGQGRRKAAADPSFRVLVLADASGEQEERVPLAQREAFTVDMDNFAKTMAAIAPAVRLAPGEAGEAAETLRFTRLDDLHPDTLYRTSAFASLHATREALRDPQSYAATAARLGLTTEATPGKGTESDTDTLHRLLGGAAARSTTSSVVDQLVRDVVSPHVIHDDRAQRRQALAEFDERIAARMRDILRDPGFRRIESTWRGLWQLVSELAWSEEVAICVLDISAPELKADVAAGGTGLLAALSANIGEDGPLSLIVADFSFSAEAADLVTLSGLAGLAKAADAPCLAAAHPSLLGCAAPEDLAQPTRWAPLPDAAAKYWQALRQSPSAAWLGLSLPRLLARLPYGKATDPVNAFAFEEITEDATHEDFVWESPVYAQARLLAEAWAEDGEEMDISGYLEISPLPSYIYRDKRGEARQKPCAETLLSEAAANAMLARGIMPLLSYRNRDAVRILRWQSVASPARPLAGVFSA